MRRQGEGGHQVVRYNTTQHDGRWLCVRCGLHYVRFCDLRAKHCLGVPATAAAAKSVADAHAGGPLTRRKVHAFAKHPSGSRPGAPGARLPSDLLELDPTAPRPPGPANVRAREQEATGSGGRSQEVPPGHRVQGGAAGAPDVVSALPIPPDPGCGPAQSVGRDDPGPPEAHVETTGSPEQGPVRGPVPEGERPRGLRALLGLGPGAGAPVAQQGSAKKKRRRKPAAGRTSASPEGHPASRIVHWLRPGGTAQNGPQGVATAHEDKQCAMDPGPAGPIEVLSQGPGDVLHPCASAPGCSSDPPGMPNPRTQVGTLRGLRGTEAPAPGLRTQLGEPLWGAAVGARLRGGQGSGSPLRSLMGPDPAPGWRVQGASHRPGVLSRIFSSPSQGGGGHSPPLGWVGGTRGSWSLTRPPAVSGRGALTGQSRP